MRYIAYGLAIIAAVLTVTFVTGYMHPISGGSYADPFLD